MTRLRELRIHGFKSFANATTFVFDEGVTAIVGPNGSGKSNVAEALRWVLGEQHYTALRGRRTEDVIFAGSDRRGQLGMAEVTLLLDNSQGGLPTEYQEVSLSRRAFRSGENQYLSNGTRVRLKDVQQLTAPLGQAHTIIGQGLVDAVLSQRPEDRRGLFEHAAGIAGLRLRTSEAERSLAEAAGNAQRLHDMLAELEPRVRSLERAARQAREYGALRDRLSELQRGYYAALWASATLRLEAAQAALTTTEHSLAEVEGVQRQAAQQLAGVRTRERELSARISALQHGLLESERAVAELAHQLELLDATRRNSAQRTGELEAACAELETQQERAAYAEREANETICMLQSSLAAARAALAECEAAQAKALNLVARRKEALAALEDGQAAINQELADLEAQRSRLGERRLALSEDLDTRTDRLREEQAAVAQCEAALATLTAQHADYQRERAQLQQTLDACAALVANQTAVVRTARDALDDLQRTRTEQRTRLELLERSADGGDGLYGGARAIQTAVRRGRLQLPGLIGTVAELIEVPEGLETAIEVALGGRLQDLVVERWADAELAIDFLKRGNAGRATFQPLETVRRPRPATLDVDDPALLGSAFELIGCRADIEAVLAQLLQRTLIVRDLDAMRRVLDQSRGWTIVTLSGEIARPGGSVTGGGAVRGSGVLARERERRELPALLRKLDERHAQACAALTDAEQALADAEQQRTNVADELAELHHAERATATDQARADQDRARAYERLERAQADLTALEERAAQLEAGAAELETRRTPLITGLAERQAEVERARALQEVDAPPDNGRILALNVELSTLGERLATAERDRRRAHEAAQAARQAGEARAAELRALREEQARATEQHDNLTREHAAVSQELDERRRAVPPLEQERAGLLERIRMAERAIDVAVDRLREAERARDNAALNLARVRDEQTFLTERIQTDLELADPAELAGVPTHSGAEIEQEIRRLRERLRRTSAVGAEVIDEHAQEAARLEHLTRELADIEQAAEHLRRLLGELRRGMQQRFQATFEQVAAEFERTFGRLFGGGAARLTHLSGADGDDGVLIEARPPGKRLQNLGQLSGGERALTAVALLFAIQRVNPSPFCVLDEVDAALDESNVLRFRDELRDLARTTQYIVITHNRGTIEGADTLYGITMGDDSVSRVVSLRLEQAIQQVEERRQDGQAAG